MIKLIAIDLDDTLLNSEKSISKENVTAVKKAHKEGIYVVITTGRPFFRTKQIIDELGLNTVNNYSICYNGGRIADTLNNTIVYRNTLNNADIRKLVYFGANCKTNILLYSDEYIYTDKRISLLDKIGAMPYLKTVENIKNLSNLEWSYKIVFIDEPKRIAEIKNSIPVDLFNHYNIFNSASFLLEFLPKDVSKGNGLLKLAEYLQINSTETMALGDEENDISMIESAYLGVAMGNACDELKTKASFITKTNENNGVAFAINKLALNNGLPKVLISSCLLGENCKYNGENNLFDKVVELQKKYDLIPICPEVLGGLKIPRSPAEICGDKVINSLKEDVTNNYHLGAEKALKIAKATNAKLAILKERSPSCGCKFVYDGTFSHKKVNRSGVTTRLLIANGIKVISEEEA